MQKCIELQNTLEWLFYRKIAHCIQILEHRLTVGEHPQLNHKRKVNKAVPTTQREQFLVSGSVLREMTCSVQSARQ